MLYEFYDYSKIKSIKTKIKISVSYSTDNKYIYPTIVSITSLIVNAGKNTLYNIYILHPPDFTENSKKIFNKFESKYKDICKIYYIGMGNKFRNLKFKRRLSIAAYYRLSLQDILPNVNKIIYLDGDTLIFGDLQELINLDMKGNVIMGFIDDFPNSIKSFGLTNPTVICSGVLLIDLKGLRKYNYTKKIEDFISKNKNRLFQQDQTIVNVVMQDRLGPIPPKYGVWPLNNEEKLKSYLSKKRFGKKYSKKLLIDAIKHPVIVHFINKKPFKFRKSAFYHLWWKFAKISGYYDEICKFIKRKKK